MFRNVLNWMLNNSPGFMRPALGWLIDGIRQITNYISQRWSSLGSVATYWRAKVIYWGHRAADFVLTFGTFITWLVIVFIPEHVAAKLNQVVSLLTSLVGRAFGLVQAGLATLQQWAVDRLAWLEGLLSALKAWAKYWLDRLTVGLSDLLRALTHVLAGPDALAEWLVAAMWRALARFVYAQRDRIALFMTQQSVAFTNWLALQVEDIVMRWL